MISVSLKKIMQCIIFKFVEICIIYPDLFKCVSEGFLSLSDFQKLVFVLGLGVID